MAGKKNEWYTTICIFQCFISQISTSVLHLPLQFPFLKKKIHIYWVKKYSKYHPQKYFQSILQYYKTTRTYNVLIHLFLFYECFNYRCICIPYVCLVIEFIKRVLDHLELEVETVVNHHLSFRTHFSVDGSLFLTTNPSFLYL